MAEAIPVFPLSHVLVPGMPLPLHIFEPRYRELLADVTGGSDTGRFGVVALRSGAEVAGRTGAEAAERTGAEANQPGAPPTTPDVEEVGTIAEILEVQRRQDGTADLLAVGSQRFRVRRLLPDTAPYLRAEIELLDEPDGDLYPGLAERAGELLELYDSTLQRVAGRNTGDALPDDANQLSFHLAARLPLGPPERQALLADATTADRLRRISGLLRREIALLQRTRTIAVSPAILRRAAGLN